ncbi:N-acetyl-gamma-glutamyl-phosphate reductase [Nocardiopsis alkaliphila]|uniref:N-acetyl-gamma-glutamyl-phosphate reductase n=1 Tax=Nocardiopsis alkaliphila TaxID=225762 RepID=UPI00037DD9AF|nr:N-acetyl-gamma-glutamyl-phosphate reductase [Nocardiopsis alkaliphila]
MKAAVIGASGYVGGELVRLLLAHPALHLVQVTSRRHAGAPVGRRHPNLSHVDLKFTPLDALSPVDVVFSALPHGELSRVHSQVAQTTRTIVDLSSDFREHEDGAKEGYVTGLPELFRKDLLGRDRISVPGCMATAAALALRPLVEAGMVEGDTLVDARTGSSGAGVEPGAATHHAERRNAMRVYKATGHRHEHEITRLCRSKVRMTVTAVPLVRGVQIILHVRTNRPVSRTDVWSVYRRRYDAEPFIRLVAHRLGVHRLPDPQFLMGANFTDIGFDVDEDGGRVVVVVALDNLMKGAAGGAVQSLNVSAGFDEEAGLDFAGLRVG